MKFTNPISARNGVRSNLDNNMLDNVRFAGIDENMEEYEVALN